MHAKTRVEAMTTEALEEEVFSFASEYFDYIGPKQPDVVTFRRLVEQRDLRGLRLNWGRLADSFVRMEAAAGHRGRPLIMDYYFTYSEALVELCKRQIQAMTTSALEDSVFRFEGTYFDLLPGDDPDVVAFRTLVEKRDLAGLRQRWASLLDSFMRLESEAHPPVPLRFLDVYYLHFEMLVELCRRRAA